MGEVCQLTGGSIGWTSRADASEPLTESSNTLSHARKSEPNPAGARRREASARFWSGAKGAAGDLQSHFQLVLRVKAG
jgi:hypothetical protein